MPERILVVGHSAITCLGRTMDATWDNLDRRVDRGSRGTLNWRRTSTSSTWAG